MATFKVVNLTKYPFGRTVFNGYNCVSSTPNVRGKKIRLAPKYDIYSERVSGMLGIDAPDIAVYTRQSKSCQAKNVRKINKIAPHLLICYDNYEKDFMKLSVHRMIISNIGVQELDSSSRIFFKSKSHPELYVWKDAVYMVITFDESIIEITGGDLCGTSGQGWEAVHLGEKEFEMQKYLLTQNEGTMELFARKFIEHKMSEIVLQISEELA
jgi:hypothetical protein